VILFSRIFVLLGLLSLGACGFSPVYSEKSGAAASAQLRNIEIAPAGERTSQLVRNQLIKQFSDRGETPAPQFYLSRLPARAQPIAPAFHSYNMDSGIAHVTISDIAEDKYGFLWLASQSGVDKFRHH